MAASVTISGFGTTLGYGTAFPANTLIAEIQGIKGPEQKGDKFETTHMTSPGGIKEFLVAMIDPGNVTLTINYVSSQIVALNNLLRVTKKWSIYLPDGVRFDFTGAIMSLGYAIPHDNRITQDIEIAIYGPLAINNAS
jgi:hypothetical protein